MSKDPVEFDFREALTSAEHNQQTLDYLFPGRVVWNYQITPVALHVALFMGWYLYDPAVQTADRMRLYGAHSAPLSQVQTSIDSGVSWQNLAFSSVGIPATVVITVGNWHLSQNLQVQQASISLAGIATPQWIGAAMTFGPGEAMVNYTCMLYHSANDPF